MRPMFGLRRRDEKQMQRLRLTLKRDDGSRTRCQFCAEDAAEGIPIYDASQITRFPLRIGIHGVLLRCEACRDADRGKGGVFYRDTYGKWFKG